MVISPVRCINKVLTHFSIPVMMPMLPLGCVSIGLNGGSFQPDVKAEKSIILSILHARDQLELLQEQVSGGKRGPSPDGSFLVIDEVAM
jgi:hypothetical protein